MHKLTQSLRMKHQLIHTHRTQGYNVSQGDVVCQEALVGQQVDTWRPHDDKVYVPELKKFSRSRYFLLWLSLYRCLQSIINGMDVSNVWLMVKYGRNRSMMLKDGCNGWMMVKDSSVDVNV